MYSAWLLYSLAISYLVATLVRHSSAVQQIVAGADVIAVVIFCAIAGRKRARAAW